MNTDNMEVKRKRIELAVKLLGLGAVAFFIAPIIMTVIHGLIGMIVAAAIGLPLVYATPAIGSALANWRLKLLKMEAMKNPIETLQNDFQKRQDALKQFAHAISSFKAEKDSFEDKVQGFKKQYPEEAPKYAQQLDEMNQLLEVRKQKYKQAQHSLELYAAEIQKASAIWEMAQAAAQMSKAAGVAEDDYFAKIQTDTALNSVQKSMNVAFADLEVSLLDEKEAPKQLAAPAKTEDLARQQNYKTKIAV